jgi:hypothetical protein
MGQDKAVAPTGCAASLLNGQTTYHGCMVPVGRKAHNEPCQDALNSKLEHVQSFILDICKVFALLKDEHSMDSKGKIGHGFGNALTKPGSMFLESMNC